MDINQLIDSDTSGSRSKKEVENQHPYPSGHHRQREQRPPQPPPLRPPLQNEFRSPSASSYNSVHSPYQKTPSSAFSTGQYPFPQPSTHSPTSSTKAISSHHYEAQSFVPGSTQQAYGQTVSLPQTPTSTTPGSSYPSFHQQRPPSSHSASTPTSGNAQTPTFLRDSPQQPHAQIRGPYGPNPNHQYLSQPGTPLGPPTSLGRQGSSLRRESPGSYDQKRTNSGGSHGQQLHAVQSPTNISHNPSVPSSVMFATPHIQSPPQQSISLSQNRDRSISVSPKTTLPRQPAPGSIGAAVDTGRTPNVHVMPAKRKIGDSRVDEPTLQEQPAAKRSMSLGVASILNADNEHESRTPNKRSHVLSSNVTQVPPHIGIRDSNASVQSSVDPRPASLSHTPSQEPTYSSVISSPTHISFAKQPMHPGGAAADSSEIPSQASSKPKGSLVAESTSSVHPPAVPGPGNDTTQYSNSFHNKSTTRLDDTQSFSKSHKPWKRYRNGEVPIFAQQFDRRGGSSKKGRRQVMSKSPSFIKQEPTNSVSHPSVKQQQTNGHDVSSMDGVRLMEGANELLTPWEPTMTNIIPSEELTRTIMDHLIATVHPMNESVLDMVEIEAKIGQITDKDTNARVRIPVMTETLLDRNNPSLHTKFESSMTESQHSQLNKCLNKALLDSRPPLPGAPPRKGEPRLPLDYVHTYETDTFYDLSANAMNALPPFLHGYIGRGKQPRARITTDQKTGKVTRMIIKVNVNDIEIYSPQTPFDWRVSVNLEVKYDGNVKDLVESTEGKDRKSLDRNKNRMTYKHGPYQVDLTQVTPPASNAKVEKKHELEIELSTAAFREQALRALRGQENRYDDLIKGFVDNVRIVVRHCKPL
ncbi:MAG: hypothetical protein Q9209_006131 [Squamulea sp. 1 TL-2023]